MDLAALRSYAEGLFNNQAFASSTFIASKLVTLSNGEAQDVFLLARSLFATEQNLQAAKLLESHGLLKSGSHPFYVRTVLLCAQCYGKAGMPDEVLKVSETITSQDCDDLVAYAREISLQWGAETYLIGQLALERGKSYEKLENRKRAILWLRVALHLDVRCFEAFERLLALQLSNSEEAELLQSLERAGVFNDPVSAWMKPLFRCMMGKFDCATSCETKFAEAERLKALPDGPSLADDPLIIGEKAEVRYHQHDVRGAYEITRMLIAQAACDFDRVALTHIAAMVELSQTTELFSFAHRQIKAHPKRALSWYAVGSYYFSVRRYGVARDYFSRATALDPGLLAAWVSSAHAHALYDESDRAMAIYRTAARIFPGSHLPVMGTAMEYLRTNNVTLAEQFCQQALLLCESDPALHNEMGVVHYRKRRYNDAVKCFEEAIKKSSGVSSTAWFTAFEHLYFNLGHAHRRAGNLEKAISAYEDGLSRAPNNASGRASLGMAYHMLGQIERAFEQYHIALGLRPNDTLLKELLDIAVQDLPVNVL